MLAHLMVRTGSVIGQLILIGTLFPVFPGVDRMTPPRLTPATPVKARCIKIEATRLRPNPNDKNLYRMQLAEVEVYVRNPTGDQNSTYNLAPGAAVTTSSSFEALGWATDKINDGAWNSESGSQGWSSEGDTSTNHTEWVQLNLGASYTLYKVDLYPRNDPGAVGQGFPVDFTIQVTNDATCFVDWVTVVTRVDYPMPGDAGQSFNFTAPTR